MKIDFYTYIGLAGDEHVLLVAETNDGRKAHSLFNRCLPFYDWRLERAKNRLKKELVKG